MGSSTKRKKYILPYVGTRTNCEDATKLRRKEKVLIYFCWYWFIKWKYIFANHSPWILLQWAASISASNRDLLNALSAAISASTLDLLSADSLATLDASTSASILDLLNASSLAIL